METRAWGKGTSCMNRGWMLEWMIELVISGETSWARAQGGVGVGVGGAGVLRR